MIECSAAVWPDANTYAVLLAAEQAEHGRGYASVGWGNEAYQLVQAIRLVQHEQTLWRAQAMRR